MQGAAPIGVFLLPQVWRNPRSEFDIFAAPGSGDPRGRDLRIAIRLKDVPRECSRATCCTRLFVRTQWQRAVRTVGSTAPRLLSSVAHIAAKWGTAI